MPEKVLPTADIIAISVVIIMSSTEAEIIAVTQRLLNSISAGDYDTYKVR